MSAIVNGEFFLHETWIIRGRIRDDRGAPVDITDAQVSLRLASAKGILLLDLSTPGGGSILDPEDGLYEFVIGEDEQETAEIQPGAYRYEVRVELPDGRISVQNAGTITVHPSLFA